MPLKLDVHAIIATAASWHSWNYAECSVVFKM